MALEDRIEEVASGPAAASGDAGSVTQQRLSDLIKADKHLKGEEGVEKKTRGLRFTKLVAPGPLD